MKVLKLNPETSEWETLTEEDWIRIEVDGCLYDIQGDMLCGRGGIKMEGGLQIMGVDNRVFDDPRNMRPGEVLSGQNGYLKLWMHTANNFTVGPR